MHVKPCDLSDLKNTVLLYPSPPSASQQANVRELVRRSGKSKKVKIVKLHPVKLSPTDTYTSGFEAMWKNLVGIEYY